MGITNNRVTGRSQTFTYDAFNRIATGQSQATSGSDCWGQSFTIDAWGNLTNETVTKCSAPPLNAPATTKNQISGYCYDLAGNLLGTTGCPSLPYTPTYIYDAEGHLRGSGGVNYTYDGDGNRIIKSNGTLYWGAGSLAESDLSGSTASWKDYIFFDGKRVAKRDSTTTHYFFSDHLGSASVIRNDSTGVLEEDLVYSPYGVLMSGTSADHYMFTGKERDSESGLDNFGARYDASSLGRFMTPDPLMASAHARDPQTWNRYAYTLNNPLRFVDPDGMEVSSECAKDPKCKIVVNLNVIYDKSVKWSDKDKKTIEAKFLEKAKKDFGRSNIELKATYSEGTFTRNDSGYHMTGLKKDSLNVYFSNGTGTGHTGVSFATPSGDVTIVDASHLELLYKNWLFPVGTNTFEHELAHQFLGHPYLSQGSRETETDWNVYKQGVWNSSNQRFRTGLEPRSYAVPASPEAIKPKQ